MKFNLSLNSLSQLLTVQVTPADISIDSGLTVIHQHLPSTPVVVVDVWLRGCYASLKTRLAWLTFLEHDIQRHSCASSGVFDREVKTVVE